MAAFFVVNSSSAAVVYSNGPSDGATGAGFLNAGYAIADFLTVDHTTDISGVEFTVWTTPGETPSTVDWAFTADPGGFPAGQTTALTVIDVRPSSTGQQGAYAVEDVGFDVQGVQLTAGTWYLVLQNGFTAEGGQLLWDENFGPSAAFQRTVGAVGSETFTIYSDNVAEPLVSGGVPEPSTWALMLSGFGILGGAARLRRRPVPTA